MFIHSRVQPPPLPESIVFRPRVDQRIADLITGHSLTLVAATAGAGKTIAVRSAIRSLGRPIVWLSLDRTDVAPGRLLENLAAAMSRVGGAKDLLHSALTVQIPIAEVAGLLAEQLHAETVVVIDNADRVGSSPQAWSVLDFFMRYAPSSASFVIISRRELPRGVFEQPLTHSVGRIGAGDLAATVAEATDILDRLGQPTDTVEARVSAVDGWVAGLIYGGDRIRGSDHEQLFTLLLDRIMADLPSPVRDLLVRTAVLTDIDRARAAWITESDPAPVLEELRSLHLPITWSPDGASFKLQPSFRDHVLAELNHLPLTLRQRTHQRFADLLTKEGDLEGAVSEYLAAGDVGRARECAQACILWLLERGDLDLAESWLEMFAPQGPPQTPTIFSLAALFRAHLRQDASQLAELADAVLDSDDLPSFLDLAPYAGDLLAWAYAFNGRLDRLERVLLAAPATPGTDALRYATALARSGPPAERPQRFNGLFDVIVFQTDYYLGRLDLLPPSTGARVTGMLMGPFRIAAERVRGRTQEALNAYRQYESSLGHVELLTQVGPEVLLDAGLIDEARETVLRGRELARRSNAPIFIVASHIVEAKILLRGLHDPAAALATLHEIEGLPAFDVLTETAEVWHGLALLEQGRHSEARELLHSVTDRLVANERLLELCPAAIYLAEAEWHCDNPDESDAAADLAYDTALRIGTFHPLLQALRDFPAVATRRLDAEPVPDSRWHALTQPLLRQSSYPIVDRLSPQLHFHDFGAPAIGQSDRQGQPRLTKTFEVLAFLLSQRERSTTRSALLKTLFDEDSSRTRTYLRQCLKWLRSALPEGSLTTPGDLIGLDATSSVTSDSLLFEQLAIESSRLQGASAIEAIEEALDLYQRGPFLVGSEAEWVDARRNRLATIHADLLLALAHHRLLQNCVLDAEDAVNRALEIDPLREGGWRLKMRIARELHDRDALIAALASCEAALATIGIETSPATRTFFRTLDF